MLKFNNIIGLLKSIAKFIAVELCAIINFELKINSIVLSKKTFY